MENVSMQLFKNTKANFTLNICILYSKLFRLSLNSQLLMAFRGYYTETTISNCHNFH